MNVNKNFGSNKFERKISAKDIGDLNFHEKENNSRFKVLEGKYWAVQFDDPEIDAKLPIDLIEGFTYDIPKQVRYRVIQGEGDLILEVEEY